MVIPLRRRRRLGPWFAGLAAVCLALQIAMLVPLAVTVVALALSLAAWGWDRYRMRPDGSGAVDDRLPPSGVGN
jgi:hypothetical protein